MSGVASLLSANEVLLDLDLSDKAALFRAAGNLWERHRGMKSAEVVASLEARENLGSTGLGQGIAIPHARVDGLREPLAAFVRPKAPIPFGAPDGRPVSYCFVLLVPAEATEQHLQILAEVAEKLSNPQFRERLAAARTVEQISQLFSE